MKLFLRRQVNKVDFFFCFLTNTIFLKKDSVWLKHILRAQVFVKNFTNEVRSNFFVFKFFNSSQDF